MKKEFREHFKTIARDKGNTATDHVYLCILRAMAAKSNKAKEEIVSSMIAEAFSENRRPTQYPFQGLYNACVYPKSYWVQKETCWPFEFLENEEERTLFKELFEYVYHSSTPHGKFEFIDKPYSYVFVRNDLSTEQKIVQSSHVAIELGYKLGEEGDMPSDLHLVLIGVDDIDEVSDIAFEKNLELHYFREPDLNNIITAAVTNPLYHRQRKHLRKFKPLTLAA